MLFVAFFINGCGSSSVGNPTAKEILDGNNSADIIKLDGLIYQRDTNSSSKSQNYSKGEKVGEIKKRTTNTWWYRNLYATKLSKGTEVFSTDEEYKSGDAPFVILIEMDGELIVYHSLREG